MMIKIKGLVVSVVGFTAAFCILILYSFYKTINESGLVNQAVCFESKCISNLAKNMDGILLLFQGFGWVITTFVTVYGVIIALNTYYSGVQNSNISNHTTHLNMFRDFLNSELSKRNAIYPDSINIFKWYGVMFPKSREGVFIVSAEYKEIMCEIKGVIEDANNHIISADKDYKYKTHQRKLIEVLGKIGISMSNGPKNTFVEIEEQVFEYLDTINLSFSSMKIQLSKIDRKYI